jgi:sortase B
MSEIKGNKDNSNRKRHRRGRRDKKDKKKADAFTIIILILAIGVFCFSGFQLFRIFGGYHEGRKEYKEIQNVAITEDQEGKFRVDFKKLSQINGDTIGWLRFNPEPAIISYPVVQTNDNDRYLHNTFSANENTLGAIFMDYRNSAGYADSNTIIYGHRMKDGSMFKHLEDYKEPEFLKANPNFFIYTPDGRELTYEIFSVGRIVDDSQTYQIEFNSEEEIQGVFDLMVKESAYDTGVSIKADDKVVTLSTCTAESDNHRFVVHGKLVKDIKLD